MNKLSPQMIRMLCDIKAGLGTHGTAHGRSEHGGRYATAQALRRKGLLNSANELTEDGHKALTQAGVNDD